MTGQPHNTVLLINTLDKHLLQKTGGWGADPPHDLPLFTVTHQEKNIYALQTDMC